MAELYTDIYGNQVTSESMVNAGALAYDPNLGYAFDDGSGGRIYSSNLVNPSNNPYHKSYVDPNGGPGGVNFNGVNLSDMNDSSIEAAKTSFANSINSAQGVTPERKAELISMFNSGADSYKTGAGANVQSGANDTFTHSTNTGSNTTGTTGTGTTGTGTTGTGTTGTGVMSSPVDYAPNFANVNQNIAGVQSTADLINAGIGGIQTGVSDIQTGVTGLGSDISNVQTGVTNVGTAIGTPVDGETVLSNQADLATGQSGIKTSMEDSFTSAQTDRDAQTAKIMADVQAKYDLTDAQVQKLSQDVLSGQSTLIDDIAKMSASQDTYYGGLADTQSQMQTSLGDITGNLGDFRTTYDENVTQQNLKQGQLMNQVAGGFDYAAKQRQAIADSGSVQSNQTDQAVAGLSMQFANAAKKLAQNSPATTTTEVDSQNSFLGALNNLKQTVANTQPSDPNYASMKGIADAFDQNGKLIAESNTMDGGMIARAITEDGNLVTNVFNQTGMSINNYSLNLDSMLSQFNTGQGLMS